MNLRGVSGGDLVRVKGDPSLWLVESKRGRKLAVRLTRGARTRQLVTSYEVEEAWRKVRR